MWQLRDSRGRGTLDAHTLGSLRDQERSLLTIMEGWQCTNLEWDGTLASLTLAQGPRNSHPFPARFPPISPPFLAHFPPTAHPIPTHFPPISCPFPTHFPPISHPFPAHFSLISRPLPAHFLPIFHQFPAQCDTSFPPLFPTHSHPYSPFLNGTHIL